MLFLPEEILVLIFLHAPLEVLYGGVLERVCRRWRDIMQDNPFIQKKKEDEKWTAYEKKIIHPKTFVTHAEAIMRLAVGPDNQIYCIASHKVYRVWPDNARLQTNGFSNCLAVGNDGKIYVGSNSGVIEVLSAEGNPIRTLRRGDSGIFALTVGMDGNIYAATSSGTIQIWSAVHETHLRSFQCDDSVTALATGPDGKIYAALWNHTIEVWSKDGVYVQTLRGHTDYVLTVAVGPDGKVYSGSADTTIRVWSDGVTVKTRKEHKSTVTCIVIGKDNIFSVSWGGSMLVWGVDGTLFHTIDVYRCECLAIGDDGKVYSGSADGTIRIW